MNETPLFTLIQTVALVVFEEEVSVEDFDLRDLMDVVKQLDSGRTIEDIVAEQYGECSTIN